MHIFAERFLVGCLSMASVFGFGHATPAVAASTPAHTVTAQARVNGQPVIIRWIRWMPTWPGTICPITTPVRPAPKAPVTPVRPAPKAPVTPVRPAPAPKAPVTPAPAPKAPVTPAPAPKAPVTPAPAPKAPAPAPAGLTAEEAQMLQLVNGERANAGLPALQADTRLVQTARAKSQDMINLHYFDHQSPDLGSPFDQMRAAGISYMTAGENIAGNQSVAAAHQALMNSAGHRANILNRNFTKIGIGIIHGGSYGIMFTQQFIG